MCVEFEAAKYVPTNWMTDCKNKNWNQSYKWSVIVQMKSKLQFESWNKPK